MKTTVSKKLKKALTALLILFLFQQCQDTGSTVKPEINNLSANRDFVVEDLAKRMAQALGDVSVRDFVKKKSTSKFDGDYNFLIHENLNEPLAEDGKGRTITLQNVLFPMPSNLARQESLGYIDSIKLNFPLLQIAIPKLSSMDAELWDTEALQPLVAFIPSDIKNHKIEAFDQNGNKVLLSATEEPSQLVIVIGENERLAPFPKTEGPIMCSSVQPYYSNEYFDYYFMEDLNDCQSSNLEGLKTDNGFTSRTAANDCDRDLKQTKDVVNKMKFNSMSEFRRANEWFDGGQEIHATIFFAQPNGAITKLTKVKSGRDGDFKDCGLFNCNPIWFGFNTEVVTWDKSMYGSAMLYMWLEHDSGDTKTYTSGFSSTYETGGIKNTLSNQVSATITDDDDLLGESIVEYCDNTDGNGELYNTGRISFYVKQR